MFKNRGIKKKLELPACAIKYPNLPQQERKQSAATNVDGGLCFGDVLSSQVSIPEFFDSPSSDKWFNAPNDSFSTFDIVSFDKSSSSSLSWSEEIEGESTELVQIELERMERVLQGLEPIPAHYDRSEYELWIKQFPQLIIHGQKLDCHHLSRESSNTECIDGEEIIAMHSSMDPNSEIHSEECDKGATSTEINRLNQKTKKAVIDMVFNNITSKLFKEKSDCRKVGISSKRDQRVAMQHNISACDNRNKSLEESFESFLKISPLLPRKTPATIRQAQKPLTVSKWLRDDSLEYASLTHFQTDRGHLDPMVSSGVNLKHHSKNSKPTQHVTLPPINKPALTRAEFRSVSATPRYQNKSLSAVSLQTRPSEYLERKLNGSSTLTGRKNGGQNKKKR